jgi:hypothetical protein
VKAVSSAFFDGVTRGASQALLMIDILALSEAKKYALVGIMLAECAVCPPGRQQYMSRHGQ